jgi:large subunit ribosomal protein L25
MNLINLKVEVRGSGKRPAKDVRNKGLVPGVYYSKGEENINIAANPLDLRPVVYTPKARLIELDIEGQPEKKKCILKDITFDPVTDKITHFDLLGITEGQKITVELPISLVGQSPGVRAGGRIYQSMNKVKLKCMPEDFVEEIKADVSKLQMGQSLALKDLDIANFELDISPNTVFVHVAKPRGGQDDEEEETAAGGTSEE